MASLEFTAPPKIVGSPLIYLVGLLAISDNHINIVVGPHNFCVALKLFNSLSPKTLFWSSFIYYPLTHRLEVITLGWIKKCVKWFWDNFEWAWQTETCVIVKVTTYSTPRTLEFKSCPVFPLWPESSIEVWLTDRKTGRQERQTDKKTSMLMLVVLTKLKRQ